MSSAPFPIYQLMECWAAHAFGTPEVRAHHHALYYALLNLVKTKSGLTRFALSYGHGMECSGIGSKATYLAALRELQAWGFLTYTPGENRFVLPIIEVTIRPSIGPLLALYRTAIDTSTGRNKEVKRLEGDDDVRTSSALEEKLKIAEAEIALLRSQLNTSPAEKLVAAPAPPTKPAGRPREIPADEAPVFTAKGFREFVKSIGYGHADVSTYLLQIQRKAETQKARTNEGWEGFILAYLNNDRKHNCLLLPEAQAPVRNNGFGPAPTVSVATGSYDRQAIAAKQATQIIT